MNVDVDYQRLLWWEFIIEGNPCWNFHQRWLTKPKVEIVGVGGVKVVIVVVVDGCYSPKLIAKVGLAKMVAGMCQRESSCGGHKCSHWKSWKCESWDQLVKTTNSTQTAQTYSYQLDLTRISEQNTPLFFFFTLFFSSYCFSFFLFLTTVLSSQMTLYLSFFRQSKHKKLT